MGNMVGIETGTKIIPKYSLCKKMGNMVGMGIGCNSLNCGNMWGICGEYGVIPKYCGNMWGMCGEYGGNGN